MTNQEPNEESPAPAHKICITCGFPKEDTDFAFDRTKGNPQRRNTVCKSCANARGKQYREQNRATYNARIRTRRAGKKDIVRAQKQAYYARHKERLRAEAHAKWPQRREKALASMRQWQQTHQEEVIQYRRTHQKQATTNAKAWLDKHPEKKRLYVARYTLKHGQRMRALRRAREYALPATFTEQEQAFCRQYWHYACAICGREEGFEWTLAMDHWIPITSQNCPGTIATNMIPLCHGRGGCNNAKHAHEPGPWLQERFGKRKAKALGQKIETYFALVKERH